MAFDAFLIFNDPKGGAPKIHGETRDEDMKKRKAFEIDSFSFSIENTLAIGSKSGGAGAGKAQFNEFSVSKSTDSGSGPLFKTCCCGGHYDKVELVLRKSGGGGENKSGADYLKFTFALVAVKSISWSGSSGDDVPQEEVAFEYGALKVEYAEQDPSTGKLGAFKPFQWSRVTNKDNMNV